MTELTTLSHPIANTKDHAVHFGHIDGEDRGTDIMTGTECFQINDPYYWLRSDDRTDKNVLDYLTKENLYTESKLFETDNDTKLFEELKSDLKGLINEDDESIRTIVGNQTGKNTYRIFSKNVTGYSHKFHYLEVMNKATGIKVDHLLVNENSYKDSDDPDKRCDINRVLVSNSHKYLSFCIDTTGNEQYELLLFDISDLESRKPVSHKLPKLLYANYHISKDERFIFYTMADSTNRINSVYIYDMESQISKKIFQEDSLIDDVDFSVTTDEEFLLVTTSSFQTMTHYYLDIKNTIFSDVENSDNSPLLKKIQDGIGEEKYTVDKIGNYFIFLTNKLGNKDYIPMFCKIGENTSQSEWNFIDKSKLEIKLDKSLYDCIYYDSITILQNYVVFEIRYNGITKIVSTKFDTSRCDMYPFDKSWSIMSPIEETGVLSIVDVQRELNSIVVSHSSLISPKTFMNYKFDNKECLTIKTKVVPNFNKDNYVSTRVYALSNDGVKVPMSLVYNKQLTSKNGPHKVHLYGYGSYGLTIESEFNSSIIPLLDRGFIYAIAHVRGGSFMGNQWYENGKMMNKLNTFHDFEACAKYLIDSNYTTPNLMSAEGRSAGGLLAGYCITKLPHLFNAVLAGVPFVDVLTTMSDPSIPLTTPEWLQWGNSNNREQFDYMRQYSPYDNITNNIDYPHYYVYGGLHDPRVQYWEPTKFVAKLRSAQTSGKNKLQILDIKINDGHFDSSDRYKSAIENAKYYLFLLKSLEIKTPVVYNVDK
jgi:oligopeptidase B